MMRQARHLDDQIRSCEQLVAQPRDRRKVVASVRLPRWASAIGASRAASRYVCRDSDHVGNTVDVDVLRQQGGTTPSGNGAGSAGIILDEKTYADPFRSQVREKGG